MPRSATDTEGWLFSVAHKGKIVEHNPLDTTHALWIIDQCHDSADLLQLGETPINSMFSRQEVAKPFSLINHW
jgi:hypothetical protein